MNVSNRIRLQDTLLAPPDPSFKAQDPSFGGELPVRHAGRSSAFGGRIQYGELPVRHAGRSSAFGGRIQYRELPVRHAGRSSAFGGRI
jgi:hypothetical protein